MIMVDELRVWPHAKHACFKNGSAHLTADGPRALWDLHMFAKRLGLKREWFQNHPLAPHYDLSPAMHAKALAAGATLVPAREQALLRQAARAAEQWLAYLIESEERDANEVNRDVLAAMFPDWECDWHITGDTPRGFIESRGRREDANNAYGVTDGFIIT